jgi:hypothetical protein
LGLANSLERDCVRFTGGKIPSDERNACHHAIERPHSREIENRGVEDGALENRVLIERLKTEAFR